MKNKLVALLFVMAFSLHIDYAYAMALDDAQSGYDNVSVISVSEMPKTGPDMRVKLLPGQNESGNYCRCKCNNKTVCKTENPVIICCGCIVTTMVSCPIFCAACVASFAKEACCPRK